MVKQDHNLKITYICSPSIQKNWQTKYTETHLLHGSDPQEESLAIEISKQTLKPLLQFHSA